MKDFRTAVITGGAKGIGAFISRGFYDAGYAVVIGGREDIGYAEQLGSRARFIKVDVTRPQDLEGLAKETLNIFGRLDVWINNAGISEWRSISDIDTLFWERMIDTNLKGAMFGCKAAAGVMTAGGVIINVSSLAGKRGSANNSVYCAAKFGVNGLTQALAKELGPRGIRVNAVCPVYVRTDGLLSALQSNSSPSAAMPVNDYLEDFARSQAALQRLPEGNEIADTCVFIASTVAGAITGQCINIDCGVLPQ